MHPRLRYFLTIFLALYLGCLGCALLQAQWGWSSILASSALGFAVTFLPWPARLNQREIQVAFYTGTFAGMSSSQILSSPLQILAVSLVGAALYLAAKPYFNGLGGRMGALAFLATSLLLLLRIFA
jgi:hypothetical protein